MGKSSSKWIEDVELRPEALKLLEGSTWEEALNGVGLGVGEIRHVGVALKAQRTEAKAERRDCMQ